MALKTPTISKLAQQRGTLLHAWTGVTEADTFDKVYVGDADELSVQISGTFGSPGATVVVQGSNDDGATWFTLNDLGGTAISKTAAALVGIREKVRHIRLSASGGTGQSLNAYLLAQRIDGEKA